MPRFFAYRTVICARAAAGVERLRTTMSADHAERLQRESNQSRNQSLNQICSGSQSLRCYLAREAAIRAFAARLPADKCMPKYVFQRKLSWQICYHTCVWHRACNRCVLSSTGCLPAQQEKTLLSVGCGQRTRAPRHICGALCRTIYLISACV